MEDEIKVEEVAPVENPAKTTTPVIESANVAAKRIEEATEALKLENDRTERLAVEQTLSGKSEAGLTAPKPEPISDEKYAEMVEKGEVNPFADDGLN